MCGIAGILDLKQKPVSHISHNLNQMGLLLKHRGPDGHGLWIHDKKHVGFAHRRLSIIDLATGNQPMTDIYKNTICFNGEVYNYIELRNQLKDSYNFRTQSDTEVILAAYKKWGNECASFLRGMYAFAIWDEKNNRLFCARDRFGIKPFYYTTISHLFIFASEPKALLPFQKTIETNMVALKEYISFQYTLGEQTLFANIQQLLPAHYISIRNNSIIKRKYWDIQYLIDASHKKLYYEKKLLELLQETIRFHMRSDVPVGAYLSGGLDSGIVTSLMRSFMGQKTIDVFHGTFTEGAEFNETRYAKTIAKQNHLRLHSITITSDDFIKHIRKLIYFLDYPVAGPASFAQYMVSMLASRYLKVVLGGQGGDEVFGGYTRYLVAYFEQCIKGAIEGTIDSVPYIVTYKSILSNLSLLKNYKPMLQYFWKKGLFENKDKRYFRLIDKSELMCDFIDWDNFGNHNEFSTFKKIFWSNNIQSKSYFDQMSHFDFKTLLPALLHVEDRVSMAHGLESRVPFLDHRLVEFMATLPATVKFYQGDLKHILKRSINSIVPKTIINRKDKMGFPVPFSKWIKGSLKNYILEIFTSKKAKQRSYLTSSFDIEVLLSRGFAFDRSLWGLLCLELWQQEFHDKESYYKKIIPK
jgi:asparagine synthase (glutamine-hydrolysing)